MALWVPATDRTREFRRRLLRVLVCSYLQPIRTTHLIGLWHGLRWIFWKWKWTEFLCSWLSLLLWMLVFGWVIFIYFRFVQFEYFKGGFNSGNLVNLFMPRTHLGLVGDASLFYWHSLSHVMRQMITFHSTSTTKNLLVDDHYMTLENEEQRKWTKNRVLKFYKNFFRSSIFGYEFQEDYYVCVLSMLPSMRVEQLDN